MKPIIVDKYYKHTINVPSDGIYIIEITARAKNWWQNKLKLFDDDDLRVEIDEIKFPKLYPKKRGLFNSPASWNGNKLKNLRQTNLFIIYLEKGEHILHFFSDQKPIIIKNGINTHPFQNNQNILKIVGLAKPNSGFQAEDGDRRPWLNIILVNLPLNALTITAIVEKGETHEKHKRDDDDLKLIINGEIQKNNTAKSHKCWYWCGKTIKEKSKIFRKIFELPPALNYIELWADRTPALTEIKLQGVETIGFRKPNSEDRIQKYNKVVKNEDYNRFDQEILDAADEWNKEFLSQKYPPPEPLDANLVKAMIYIESRMGYYTPPKDYYPAYPDIMQVADKRNPAIHTLNNDGWINPNTGEVAREFEWEEGKGKYGKVLDYKGKANGDKPKESIYWGVRWLYHKAQGITNNGERYWRPWNEAVRNYNSEGNVKYEKNAYNVYEDGVDKRKKPWIKLWISILAFLGISIAGAALGANIYSNQGIAWLSFEESNEFDVEYVLTLNIIRGLRTNQYEVSKRFGWGGNRNAILKESNPYLGFRNLFGRGEGAIVVSGEDIGDNVVRYIFKENDYTPELVYIKGEYGDKDIEPAFNGDWVEFVDIDGDEIYEVRESNFIPYSNASDTIWSTWYHYNKERGIYEFFKKEVKTVEEQDLWELIEPGKKTDDG
ncbi:MAG: hypothetical protein KKD35_05425 [Elusimicrobia bacterium]|nr:hypothetical protein [Elusimicrobiota bacterium]